MTKEEKIEKVVEAAKLATSVEETISSGYLILAEIEALHEFFRIIQDWAICPTNDLPKRIIAELDRLEKEGK